MIELNNLFYAGLGRLLVEFLLLTLGVVIVLLIVCFIMAVFVALSLKRGKVYFPRLIVYGLSVLGGIVKPTLRLLSVESTMADHLLIDLRNRVSLPHLSKLPPEQIGIFFPQCLRSSKCPGRLTSTGVKCIECGRCGIGKAKKWAEERGYRVFISPGGGSVRRAIEHYHLRGVVGIACSGEVREGLDMCESKGLPAVGILLESDGCIETTLSWDKFYSMLSTISEGRDGKTST